MMPTLKEKRLYALLVAILVAVVATMAVDWFFSPVGTVWLIATFIASGLFGYAFGFYMQGAAMRND